MSLRPSKGPEDCTACGVCLLSCPVWQHTADRALTPLARAKALQAGAVAEDIAASLDACLSCGACAPACPENIDTMAMIGGLRRTLRQSRSLQPAWDPSHHPAAPLPAAPLAPPRARAVLLPGAALRTRARELAALQRLFPTIATDDGDALADLLEAGAVIPPGRILAFLSGLGSARTLVVHGGLHRWLRTWRPSARVIGVGEAVLSTKTGRRAVRSDDLYIVDSRVYHADHARLARFYHRVRERSGCMMNIDLQRMAVSTGAWSLQGRSDATAAGCLDQARWILRGRAPARIVVEDPADADVFAQVWTGAIVHVALASERGAP
jgi:ferredoxin